MACRVFQPGCVRLTADLLTRASGHQQCQYGRPRVTRSLLRRIAATSIASDSFEPNGKQGRILDDASSETPHAAAAASLGASFPPTVFNLVNVIMGAGYVSIPFACKQGGWAALAVLWLLGAVFCYTGNTILQCCEHLDKRQQQPQPQPSRAGQQGRGGVLSTTQPAGYESVAGAAFGPVGRLFVSGVMYAELLGICCVYVVLEAEALSTLLSHTAVGGALSSVCGPPAYLLLASALIVPTVLLPSVEALAALGVVGVMAAVTVGSVLAGVYSSTPAALTALTETSLVQLTTLPQVLGVLAFVYAGHSTFPVIQQSMARPELGRKAVTFGYAITAAICTVIGGFGYALWGQGTQQVVTANLAAGSVLALLLTVLTAANPFSAFAVTLEPVALVLQRRLWDHTGRKQPSKQHSNTTTTTPSKGVNTSSTKHANAVGDQAADVGSGQAAGVDDSSSCSGAEVPYPVRAIIRLGLALACCATAMLLPYVTDLMAFVGALLTMTISLILPALMHLQLFKQEAPAWLLGLDCAVVLLGVLCAYVGATSALSNLQHKLFAAAV